MLATWGPERTRQVNPIDEWLALGASLAAGTDIVRPFNPMTNVWGMVTRGTKSAGVQGPEHAISVATALELYTMGTAALNHEQDRLGQHQPGQARRPGRLRSRPAGRRSRGPGRSHPGLHHRRRQARARPPWHAGALAGSRWVSKNAPDLGAPLRNRTVDLLLTMTIWSPSGQVGC
jgi:amidohydrolase family protein